jgi:CO/xanthine dehydrogenase FAD-binding subunit
MTGLEYLRPKTIAEALQWMERGVPLAGGTTITPRRKELQVVIDLSDLGLDGIATDGDFIEIGAMTRLQEIVESSTELPAALREACKLEAGWNIRNMATIGGAIMSSDGRSPFLTTLLAMDPQVHQAPSDESLSLNELLEDRNGVGLITAIRCKIPSTLLYEQVARSPADFPIVAVAIGFSGDNGQQMIRIAIGGYGSRPIRLEEAEAKLGEHWDPNSAIDYAGRAYADAGDVWASAEYRSEIASLLVGRLLKKVKDR